MSERKTMEVENAVNQHPDPKRQEREEEDIDYGKESRDLMPKLKVAREEVLEYLNNKWKVLPFEDQVNEGWNFVMTIDRSEYVDEKRTRLVLMEGVEKEDILNELQLYEELIEICQAQVSAFWNSFHKKYDPQWLGCMRKLSKIENLRKELRKDRVDRKVSAYYILETLERLSDWDGEEETDTGETTYKDLMNLLDKQTELALSSQSILDPLMDVISKVSGISMFLRRVANLKELIEEGELNPRDWT